MELIRQKVTKGLNRTHERAENAYNTRRKLVEFSVRQVVYRKNYRQSNKADGYNAKLSPNRIRCVVLQCKGNPLYELGNAVGKSVGVFHAKYLYVAWTSEQNPTTPKGDKLRSAGLHELIEAPITWWVEQSSELPRFGYKSHNQGPTVTRHDAVLFHVQPSRPSCPPASSATS